MLRKYSRSDMAQASLWMHKSEHQKLAELSGNQSLNTFLMQIIRKSLAKELSDVTITTTNNNNNHAQGERKKL